MALFTPLSDEALANLVSLHDVGTLTRAEGLTRGTVNTTYRLTTDRGLFYLRLSERAGFWDLVHEKDLLLWLMDRPAPCPAAPRPVKNAAGGYIFPWGEHHILVFQEVPGRELGLFELLPETCAQVGEALARFHQATRAFHGGRRHPYRRAVLSTWLRALRGAPPPLRQVNDLLWDELRALQQPLGPPTTPGTLHGDPAPENFKFHHGRLSGFIDLEDASQGPLVHDLAHALYAWGWDREDLDPARCQALVAAYQLVRALTPAERRALPWQVRAVALRQAASCILRYHWRHGEEPPLVYREYTPHLRRLERLRALRPRRLREMCGVEGMSA